MKTKHIVISFFLLLCVFVPFDHSLRSATIPVDTVQLNPIFTYWQAGRGEAMSETFITNSETTCCVEARVTVLSITRGRSCIRNPFGKFRGVMVFL